MKSTIHTSKLLPFSAYFLSNMILQCMTTYFSLRKSQSGYVVSLDQVKHCSIHQKSWVQPKSWEIILKNLLSRIHSHRTYLKCIPFCWFPHPTFMTYIVEVTAIFQSVLVIFSNSDIQIRSSQWLKDYTKVKKIFRHIRFPQKNIVKKIHQNIHQIKNCQKSVKKFVKKSVKKNLPKILLKIIQNNLSKHL